MANDKPAVVAAAAVKTESFSGPIPPPSALKLYEEISPGFAERIMAMAEREQEARIQADKRNQDIAAEDITAARGETKRGQWLAAVITVFALASSVYCASIGQPWVAGVIAGTTLASIVSTLVNRGHAKK